MRKWNDAMTLKVFLPETKVQCCGATLRVTVPLPPLSDLSSEKNQFGTEMRQRTGNLLEHV